MSSVVEELEAEARSRAETLRHEGRAGAEYSFALDWAVPDSALQVRVRVTMRLESDLSVRLSASGTVMGSVRQALSPTEAVVDRMIALANALGMTPNIEADAGPQAVASAELGLTWSARLLQEAEVFSDQRVGITGGFRAGVELAVAAESEGEGAFARLGVGVQGTITATTPYDDGLVDVLSDIFTGERVPDLRLDLAAYGQMEAGFRLFGGRFSRRLGIRLPMSSWDSRDTATVSPPSRER
jgi:hypothetical protein